MKDKKVIITVLIILIAILLGIFVISISKKSTFEVKFVSDNQVIETKQVKKNDKVSKPSNPVKEGYIFVDWYLENEIYNFNTKITKDITLVAKWQVKSSNEDIEKFTVSFDSNGGSDVAPITVEKNGTVEKPLNPTKLGYKFISWQLNGIDFDFSSKVLENITLVAKWENENNPTKPSTIGVDSISLSANSLNLKINDQKQLKATINPNNATDKNIKWASSNTSVATVDSSGKVTAVGQGSATITATVGGKTATCNITVEKNITYSIEWVEIKESNIGQFTLYIKSSEGNYVSGKVEITTVNDKTSEVEVPTTGVIYIKNAIKNVVVKSIN